MHLTKSEHMDDSARARFMALEHGIAAARSLKPGEVFLGAFDAARIGGYPEGHKLRLLFLDGYMLALNAAYPRGVRVDPDTCRILAEKTVAGPYPSCRTPEKCNAKGYCTREIACNE